MRRLVVTFILTVFLAVFFFKGVSFSQTILFGSENNDQKSWGNYFVSGILWASYLLDDVKDQTNLFLSQFNLKQGLNIGQISFQAYRKPGQGGGLDVISLDVKGFGAEPYGRAMLKLEKRNLFFLTGGYTERKYFADVDSFANPLFEPESEEVPFSSFHTWNSTEKTFDLNARFKAAQWLSFDAAWQRTKLEGESTLTLRLLNNEFPLQEPLNQTINVFRLGTEINIGGRIFYNVAGVYNKFELDQTASSEGENLGIRGLPYEQFPIYLTSQSRKTAVKLDGWAHSHSFLIIPYRNFSIKGSYRKSWTEGEASGQENMEGRFLWPLYDFVSRAAYTNSVELKKEVSRGNIAFDVQLLPQFSIRAGYDFYNYSIENSDVLDYSFTRTYYNRTVTQSESFAPFIEMKYKKFFADVIYAIGENLTLSGGYARSTSKLKLESHEETGESNSYNLDSFYGTLALDLSKQFKLKAIFEKGDYNKAFARLVPLKSTSTGVEGQFHLGVNLSGSFHYKYQKLENSKFSYSSSLNSYGGNLSYQQKEGLFGLSIRLSRNDLSSTMDIIRYVSLFTETEDISEYTSDVLHFSSNFWFRKGLLSLDGGYSYTKTEGTFPIRMVFPYITAAVRLVSDLALTLNYRLYSHKQLNYVSQNYKAHLFNIGFLYRF